MKRVIESLDLNEVVMDAVRSSLRAWRASHVDCLDEVYTDTDELKREIVREVYEYLRSCGFGDLLQMTSVRTGISRKSVYNYIINDD